MEACAITRMGNGEQKIVDRLRVADVSQGLKPFEGLGSGLVLGNELRIAGALAHDLSIALDLG